MTEQRFRVFVTDEVDPEGIALLHAHPEIEVVESPTLPPAQLLEVVGQYDALIGRSATRISRELLDAGTRLKVIGRAGVGVDNIAMDVATQLGGRQRGDHVHLEPRLGGEHGDAVRVDFVGDEDPVVGHGRRCERGKR